MKQAPRDSRRNRPSAASQNTAQKTFENSLRNEAVIARVSRKKFLFVSLLLIIGAGIICYANTFAVPFILDDEESILHNNAIRDWTNLKAIWDFSPNRVLTYWTLAANYRFGGLHLAGYHAVNLIIHLLTSILVLIFIRQLFLTPFFSGRSSRENSLEKSSLSAHASWIALFSALFFVTHPIQTQSVTYIIQRTASLVAMFYILAMVLYVHFRLSLMRRQESGAGLAPAFLWLVASLLATIAAMLTKQNALTLPFAIILLEFFFFAPTIKQMKRSIPWLALFLLTLFIAPAAAITSQNLDFGEISEIGQETKSIPRLHYLFTQFNVIRTYLRLLVLPVGQNLDYDYPISTSLLDPKTLFSLLILAAVFSAGIYLFRRNRLASFGIIFFFLALAVESSIIPIRDVIFEHRLYLPAIGYFLAAISIIYGMSSARASYVAPNGWPRISYRALTLLLALLVVICSMATVYRNHTWRNTLSIWRDTVEKSPNKPRPHLNLGSAYQERGRLDLAQQHYLRAIELKPNYAQAMANLGGILVGQGKIDEGLQLSQTALKIAPKLGAAHSNIGVVLSIQGKHELANQHFEKAIQQRPSDKIALFNWGYALLLQKKPEQAIPLFQKVLSLNPRDPDTYLDLGHALMQLGRREEAIQNFQRALQLRPGWAEAQSALSDAQNPSSIGSP